jgi:N-methylhydantoinase A
VAEAADGIRRVANAHMARAVRSVTVERGRDPRGFTLVAFGGSGPVHAAEIAQALGIRRLLVPILPGVFTALGMLASDIEHHFVRSHPCRFDRMDFETLAALVAEMRDEGLRTLAADGYPMASAELRFQADVRFLGQGSELTVPFDDNAIGPDGLARLGGAFADEYARTYHQYHDQSDAIITTLASLPTAARSHLRKT